MMDSTLIEKLMGFMGDYTDKTGIETNLYMNTTAEVLKVYAINSDDLTAIYYYLTEEKISVMDYTKFEDDMNFLFTQESYRRKDIYAKNVFQSKE